MQQTWNLSAILSLFSLKKYQFWFLLMLRTASADFFLYFLSYINTNDSAPKTVTGETKADFFLFVIIYIFVQRL